MSLAACVGLPNKPATKGKSEIRAWDLSHSAGPTPPAGFKKLSVGVIPPRVTRASAPGLQQFESYFVASQVASAFERSPWVDSALVVLDPTDAVDLVVSGTLASSDAARFDLAVDVYHSTQLRVPLASTRKISRQAFALGGAFNGAIVEAAVSDVELQLSELPAPFWEECEEAVLASVYGGAAREENRAAVTASVAEIRRIERDKLLGPVSVAVSDAIAEEGATYAEWRAYEAATNEELRQALRRREQNFAAREAADRRGMWAAVGIGVSQVAGAYGADTSSQQAEFQNRMNAASQEIDELSELAKGNSASAEEIAGKVAQGAEALAEIGLGEVIVDVEGEAIVLSGDFQSKSAALKSALWARYSFPEPVSNDSELAIPGSGRTLDVEVDTSYGRVVVRFFERLAPEAFAQIEDELGWLGTETPQAKTLVGFHPRMVLIGPLREATSGTSAPLRVVKGDISSLEQWAPAEGPGQAVLELNTVPIRKFSVTRLIASQYIDIRAKLKSGGLSDYNANVAGFAIELSDQGLPSWGRLPGDDVKTEVRKVVVGHVVEGFDALEALGEKIEPGAYDFAPEDFVVRSVQPVSAP